MTDIYNNYYMIIHGITVLVSVISTAFTGGVGNHVATKSVENNFIEMQHLNFVYLWIGGWCSICLVCLYQPFMQIWMGEEMMVDFPTVLMLVLYFYLLKLGDIRSLYSAGVGLWWEMRYRSIGETLMNLVLNIALGKIFGLKGIIGATIISLFLCNYIWSTRITFKHYFSLSRLKEYYVAHAKQTFITIIACALTYLLCSLLPIKNLVIICLVRLLICAVIPNIIFFVVYNRTEEMAYAKKAIFKRLT